MKQTPLGKLKKVSGRLLRLLTGQAEAPEEPAVSRMLVVDDEESICFSMSDYFSHHGFEVDTANDLDEAERLIAAKDYKIIIQDLRLGATRHPDGLDIIRRAHENNPATRIIVLTAYGSAELEGEARRRGASAFLRKPQPLSQVAQIVQGLIESPPQRARSA